jgi:predicted transcriptional regulator
MSTLSLRLPESLHKRLADLADREGISINQLIATAVAEKMAALDTEQVLEARAKRGSRPRFLAALAKVPDAAPVPGDELPADLPKTRKPAAKRAARKAG